MDESKDNSSGTAAWTLYQANAFVQPAMGFSGNPAGVCLVPSDAELPKGVSSVTSKAQQLIAAEVNCSETSFLRVASAEGDDAAPATGEKAHASASHFHLRWFTPTTEVPLCGHGTLAAAGVVFYALNNPSKSLTFHTLSGDMVAYRSDRTPTGVLMQFPRNPPTEVERTGHVDEIANIILGDVPTKSVLYSAVTKKLFLRLNDDTTRSQLEALHPDFEALLAVKQPEGTDVVVRGVSVTVKGSSELGADFMSRYFTPWNGINEDPVNGSSHTNLTPYWAKELGKTQLTTIMCSPRSGRLLLEDRPDVGKVMLGGDVFVTRSGTIHVPMAVLQ